MIKLLVVLIIAVLVLWRITADVDPGDAEAACTAVGGEWEVIVRSEGIDERCVMPVSNHNRP